MFNRLAAADPSDDPAYGHGKKLHVDWVVRQAKARQVSPDNLAEVTLALRVFAATPDAGDLNRFKTVAALTEAMLGAPRRQLGSMMAQPAHLELWQRLGGFPADPEARVDFALERLVAADPAGGRNLPHLLRWLAHATAPLLPEDLPRVQSYLELYLHNRQRLTPAAKRDLAACATAGDLGGLIAPFRKDTTYSLEERLFFEKTTLENGDAATVAETSHFRLLHVTTEADAKRLGKGTNWCTSWGDGDGRQNYFKTYADALLYLRSKHDSSVYQLHFGSWQLSDVKDRPIVDFCTFVQQHPGLLSVLAPFAVPAIPDTLIKLAQKGRADWIADLLTCFQSDPVYKRAADSVADTAIPTALTKAARTGRADWIADLLTCCQSDPVYKRAADLFADAAIPTALTKAAETGRADWIADLLTCCQSDPVYKRAADSVAATVIPTGLINAVDNGQKIVSLVVVCKADTFYTSVAGDPISLILTEAQEANKVWHKFQWLVSFFESDLPPKNAQLLLPNRPGLR